MLQKSKLYWQDAGFSVINSTLFFLRFSYLFLVVLGLHFCVWPSLVEWNGATLSSGVQAFHCSGFSCCRTQSLGCMDFSSCGSWALEHRLNSCGAGA